MANSAFEMYSSSRRASVNLMSCCIWNKTLPEAGCKECADRYHTSDVSGDQENMLEKKEMMEITYRPNKWSKEYRKLAYISNVILTGETTYITKKIFIT